MVHNIVAADLGVDGWKLFERVNCRFDEERHKSKLDAVPFVKRIAVFLPKPDDGRHVDFVERGQQGRVTLRFNKPVSARTALRRVLADLGLTYIVRRENIEVTSVARAREIWEALPE